MTLFEWSTPTWVLYGGALAFLVAGLWALWEFGRHWYLIKK